MSSDTLLLETTTVLRGLDFLERIPVDLDEELTKRKELTKISFQNLLDRWDSVKSIVPEFLDVIPKEKPQKIKKKRSVFDGGHTKVRSGSVGDLLDISISPEANYVNLISGFHNSAAVTNTRKKSIQRLFKFATSDTYSFKGDIPKSGGTLIGNAPEFFSGSEQNFTMGSDGSFLLVADQVRLQIENDKVEKKNLYCVLKGSHLLFGPQLTNKPPIVVINLETSQLGYTKKRDIQLIEGDTKYLIKFSQETNMDLWIEKIKERQIYTYIRQSILEPSKHLYQSLEETRIVDDPNYSYVRQEKYIAPNKGEYSYIHSVNCQDCHESIGKKTSTAEAVIDRGYVNTSSMHSVKSLVSHWQAKGNTD